ncbi:MAG: DUF3604 domain-containing protein, partial [Holophagales bacterium]|nr:DUF3604 domain-containing protein [Holophagales bacterium]
QGDPIGIPPFDLGGNPASVLQLERPLDCAAVTDHAEFFGELEICGTPDHPGFDSPECQTLRSGDLADSFATWFFPLVDPPEQTGRFGFCDGDPGCHDVARSVWQETVAAAIAADDPTSACRFSALVGYEWTGSPGGANLHRNVIFRNEMVPDLPVSYLDAPWPEMLHDALEQNCLEAGIDCDALVIPHNSNLSLGRMFLPTTSDGVPFDKASAERRARFEPLVEIIQHKGSSECRLGVGTSDEQCAFEQVTNPSILPQPPGEPRPFEPRAFVRTALKEGLEIQEPVGANPFELGFVGGTDDHNAAAGSTDEASFSGHLAALDGTLPGRLSQLVANPGGLTVVWAEQNTRESIFDALQRREVYATSGTRPVVRTFGGMWLPENLCERPWFVPVGYLLGEPMGGTIEPRWYPHPWQKPHLAISAFQDPGTPSRPGTALDKVQIIKGWVENGVAQEVVYDVITAADTGQPDGAPSLCTVWTDPDFDPDESAFYYARVLEMPTPRWHTVQCQAAGVDCSNPASVPAELAPCCSSDVPSHIQERAWTSPIWYSPPDPSNKSGEAGEYLEDGGV